jgi:hypothetical protein
MKNQLKTVLIAIFCTVSLYSQKKEDRRTMEWRYEIECAGVAQEGYYLVKCYTYTKEKNIKMEQAKKNAIHGVLFKGFSGNSTNGCSTVKPLCANPNIEFEKKEFFDTFFADGGKYMKYINLSNDAEMASERIKVGKEYKFGVNILVSKDMLRKDMEEAGILRTLKGF